jgi:hypothetical protein
MPGDSGGSSVFDAAASMSGPESGTETSFVVDERDNLLRHLGEVVAVAVAVIRCP